MHRGSIISRITTRCVGLALLIGALPALSQTIAITETSVTVDGHEIQLPQSEAAFEAAIGGVPVRNEELANEHSDRVVSWPNLGLVAFSNPRNRKVHAVELLVSRPPYWNDVLFGGTLSVSGHVITPTTPASDLARFGFSDAGWAWEWRRGCLYVLAITNGETIRSIEIGRDQDK